MQEEYKRKLEQEVQWYISTRTSTLGTGATQPMKLEDEKVISQRKALETA